MKFLGYSILFILFILFMYVWMTIFPGFWLVQDGLENDEMATASYYAISWAIWPIWIPITVTSLLAILCAILSDNK